MSLVDSIDIIINKRLDNIKNKKWWFDGLTDEECKIYNRYYIKQLRMTPEKREQEKEYRELNKDKINATKKIWYDENKVEINEKRKQYREQNKEILKAKAKEYNEKYRIIPNEYEERRKEKIFCECGCLIRRSNMRLHIKTPKHEETLKAKNSQTNI